VPHFQDGAAGSAVPKTRFFLAGPQRFDENLVVRTNSNATVIA